MRRIYQGRDGRLYTENEVEFGANIAGADDDFEGDGDDDLDGDDDFDGDNIAGDDDFEGDDDYGARKRKSAPRRKRTIREILKRGVVCTYSGSNVFGAAGSAVITIQPQTWFLARDLVITQANGNQSTGSLTTIIFAGKLAWSDQVGVPVATFGPGNQIRGILSGHIARPSAMCLFSITVTAAETTVVTMWGRKPRG